MDTFQSSAVKQDLLADGFNIEGISVDRVAKDANGKPLCLPYHYLKSVIFDHRLTMYEKCDLLTDELIGLERKSDGHIDHTKAGIDSKDQADAVCGALWAASKYSEEYSYRYGDNLDASLEANMEDANDTIRKQQMILEFQNELTQLYTEIAENDKQKMNDNFLDAPLSYQDIADGILVL